MKVTGVARAVAALLLVLGSAGPTLYAQSHPCDSAPPATPSLVTSSPVTIGFCHTAKDTAGAATTITQFTLRIGTAATAATLSPLSAPNSAGARYYQFSPLAVPSGTYTVTVTATNSTGEGGGATTTVCVACSYTITVGPITTLAKGPTSTITCPAGATQIAASATSTTLQTAVTAAANGTVFCLAAGVHPWTSSVTPKTGQSFIGVFGAILDGTGWLTSDTSQAAFRAHNQDIDNVLISNLTVRNMPQKGLHVFGPTSTGWIFDHVEVTATVLGIEIGSNILRQSFVHDNTTGGYTAFQATGTLIEDNEFARNGNETKLVGTHNVIVRRNFYHHNLNGIWFDANNIGMVISDNLIEDNSGNGIEVEISGKDVNGVVGTIDIFSNTIRRSTGGACIFISTSANVHAYSNTCEDNFRAIQLYLNGDAIQWPSRAQDLRDNLIENNTIVVPLTAGAWASAFSHTSLLTATDLAPYLSNTQNNRFVHNSYRVPVLTTAYWRWGTNTAQTFTQWQALPQDATGTVVLR